MYNMRTTVWLLYRTMDRVWNGSSTALCCPLVDPLKYCRYFVVKFQFRFSDILNEDVSSYVKSENQRRVQIIMWPALKLFKCNTRQRWCESVDLSSRDFLPRIVLLLHFDYCRGFFFFFLGNHKTQVSDSVNFVCQGNTCDAVLKRQEVLLCVYRSHSS